MNREDLETPLLIIASWISIEMFEGWTGLIVKIIVGSYALIRIIQSIKRWNYDSEKRREESM